MKRSFLVLAVLGCVQALRASGTEYPNFMFRHPAGDFPTTQGSPIQPNSPLADTAFFANIQIIGKNDQSETGIAVNPVDPRKIVAVANDFGCGSPMRYNYSTDGGLTWHNGCLPLPSGLVVNTPFDPTVAYDSRGNCYVCYGIYRTGSGGDSYENGIWVSKSTDGGVTFQTAVAVYTNLLNVKSGSGGSQPFEDKFFIGCDANPASPFRDQVYVTWSHGAPSSAFVIQCSRSTDGGKTWGSPVNVTRGGNPQGSVPVTGPNGEVYVAWGENSFAKDAQVQIARSEDGGLSFGPTVTIAQVKSIGTRNVTNGRLELTTKGNMRIATFPVVAVDNSNGPRSGTVYAGWQALNQGDPHVLISSSTTKGQGWTTPRVVDQSDASLDVYMPALACDPTNGDLAMVYYDSRNSPDNTGFDLYCSISKDGSQTFREYRITDRTTNVYVLGQGGNGGEYFGDYQGATMYGGTVWPCWWDCRTGAGYSNNCHIYTAVIHNGANAVTNLRATADCSDPTTATLSWTDPTSTTLGQSLTTFQIDISRNGTHVGSVANGVQTYVDHGLTPGTAYTYSVVVTASAGNSSPATAALASSGSSAPNAPSAFRVRPVVGGVEAIWTNPKTNVDGTAICSLSSVYIYSEAGSTPIDSLVYVGAPPATARRTLLLDTTKVWVFYLRAHALAGAGVLASDTTPHFVSFAGAPRPAPNYSFDPQPPQMYTTRSWGLTNKVAKSAPNSLTDSPTGNTARSSTSYVRFAPFVITAPETTLTFQHMLFCASTASATVEITTDNGFTWNVIRHFNQVDHPNQWKDSATVSQWVPEFRSILSNSSGVLAHIGDTASIRFVLAVPFLVGDGWYIDDVSMSSAPANAVRESGPIPASVTLEQNYPNPFNPATQIRFALPHDGTAKLFIVDAVGRVVETLVAQHLTAGNYSAEFHADYLPSGPYECVLQTTGQTLSRRMLLLK